MSSQLIEVQKNMEMYLGDMTGLLGKILATLGTSGNQGKDEAQVVRAQAMGRPSVADESQGAGEAQADGAQANETQVDRA